MPLLIHLTGGVDAIANTFNRGGLMPLLIHLRGGLMPLLIHLMGGGGVDAIAYIFNRGG